MIILQFDEGIHVDTKFVRLKEIHSSLLQFFLSSSQNNRLYAHHILRLFICNFHFIVDLFSFWIFWHDSPDKSASPVRWHFHNTCAATENSWAQYWSKFVEKKNVKTKWLKIRCGFAAFLYSLFVICGIHATFSHKLIFVFVLNLHRNTQKKKHQIVWTLNNSHSGQSLFVWISCHVSHNFTKCI